MIFAGDSQTQYGRREVSPALDDVQSALKQVQSRESHAFHFRPEVAVRLRAHIQGIARVPHPGDEDWFVMSKHHDDHPELAGLLFVQWPHAKSKGEAFANVARPGGPGLGKLRRLWGRGRSEHPGGLHLCGQILALAQDPDHGAPFVSFVDVSDPRNPSFITRLTLDGSHGEGTPSGITCVALTRLFDQHYLLFVYRYSSSNDKAYRGWFFRSNEPFLNQNSSWSLQQSFDHRSNAARTAWSDAYDNMAFLNQVDGSIFLIGIRGQFTDNHLDVYRLVGDGPDLTFCFSKSVRTRPIGATFRAGGCLHITPKRKLVIYAVEKAGGGAVRNLMVEEFSG